MAPIIDYRSLYQAYVDGENECYRPYYGRTPKSLSDKEKFTLGSCLDSNAIQNNVAIFLRAIDTYASVIRDESKAPTGLYSSVNSFQLTIKEMRKVDANKNGRLDNSDIATFYIRYNAVAEILQDGGINTPVVTAYAIDLANQARAYLKSNYPQFYAQTFPKDRK